MPTTSPTEPRPSGGELATTRQLDAMPTDELRALAEEFGLDASRYTLARELAEAIEQRRQLIDSMDREAMLDVIKWGRRPVASNASKEQIAQEIARIRSMRFGGLSHRGLLALARLRGAEVLESDDIPTLVKRLKKQEGILKKLGRKSRALMGSIVANIMGEDAAAADYQFLPPQEGAAADEGSRPVSLKQEIEEAGLLGGLAGRLKKTADSYLKEKMDEIEARIDKKLDDIDRRLAEWRDKEVGNRLRIIKITLWASVIVASVSLIYSYVVYLVNHVIRK
jgi:hypothetical protein